MERRLRILALVSGLSVLSCSVEQGDCLLHSQCPARQQCVEGRCAVPMDAGRPEAGPDASAFDATTFDIGRSDTHTPDAFTLDTMLMDAQAADSAPKADATIIDTLHLDSSSDDVHFDQLDAGAVRSDAGQGQADTIIPMIDGGSPGD